MHVPILHAAHGASNATLRLSGVPLLLFCDSLRTARAASNLKRNTQELFMKGSIPRKSYGGARLAAWRCSRRGVAYSPVNYCVFAFISVRMSELKVRSCTLDHDHEHEAGQPAQPDRSINPEPRVRVMAAKAKLSELGSPSSPHPKP